MKVGKTTYLSFNPCFIQSQGLNEAD